MGVAYSANIDLGSVLGGAEKSTKTIDKLDEKLKELESSMSSSLSKLNAISDAVSSKLGAALEKLPFKQVSEGMGAMQLVGVGGFNAITKATKLFGHALRWALGIFRIILIVADMLSKMNPFAWLKKALGWVTDLGKKVSELAKGQLSDSRKAKELNMTISQYKNFEKAGKISGTDYLIDDAAATRKAILDPQTGGAFATTLGISQQWAASANAVDLMEAVTNKIYDVLERNGGDAESITFTSFMKELRNNAGLDLSYLDPMYIKAVGRQQNNQFFSELKALVGKDKVDYNALQKLDRQNMKTSAAWDNVLNTALSKLAPLFTQLSKEAEKLFDIFAKWVGSGKFQKVIDALEVAIISMIQWIIDLINKWAPEGWLPEELKDWNMEMTKKKEEKAFKPIYQLQIAAGKNEDSVYKSLFASMSKQQRLASAKAGYDNNSDHLGSYSARKAFAEGNWGENFGGMRSVLAGMMQSFDNTIDKKAMDELIKTMQFAKEGGLKVEVVNTGKEIEVRFRDRKNSRTMKSVVIAHMDQ